MKKSMKFIVIMALIIAKNELYAADCIKKEIPAQRQSSTQDGLAANVETAIALLSSARPYAYFGLELSEQAREVFQSLNITIAHEYMSYGIEKNFENELIEYINKLGSFYDDCGVLREYQTSLNKDISVLASQCIIKIIREVLLGSKQETALIKIRSFLPTHQFDLARWHIDKSRQGSTFRFTIALRGPGTLFYELLAPTKEVFFSVQEHEKDPHELRKKLASLLDDETRTSKSLSSQGAVFMIDSRDGAVHSEPRLDEIRLLLAITPASKVAFTTMLEKERLDNERIGVDLSGPHQIKINF